jgi:nitroreductase
VSSDANDVFSIIHTTRAMRRLATTPVADDLILEILRAGICAPNGGNRQPWSFLIVRDADVKARVQHYYALAYEAVTREVYELAAPSGVTREQYEQQDERVRHLTEHIHEAPVWIVACLHVGDRPPAAGTGASIYPAVQNMLLAARALGLGATLTNRHLVFAKEVDAIFGLPPEVRSFAIVPIGYPLGKFGPVRRGPLEPLLHADQWGTPFSAARDE